MCASLRSESVQTDAGALDAPEAKREQIILANLQMLFTYLQESVLNLKTLLGFIKMEVSEIIYVMAVH